MVYSESVFKKGQKKCLKDMVTQREKKKKSVFKALFFFFFPERCFFIIVMGMAKEWLELYFWQSKGSYNNMIQTAASYSNVIKSVFIIAQWVRLSWSNPITKNRALNKSKSLILISRTRGKQQKDRAIITQCGIFPRQPHGPFQVQHKYLYLKD